ncbi:VOC family protein [Clostridium lacusfryxellense]|uniref:VOC family protein n=1 Tax=Clostridium lacusfryxellense TaxID=205328 RepID=UPI001C0C8E24|nr:VOC family protein [Clostridium lacusfryxellense]MBU3110011.1 VOC family protein [Clostridium lacusfryxellense]
MDDNKIMSSKQGTIVSADLTIDKAEQVREFYKHVIGWEHSEINMGDYNDYLMTTKDGVPVAGVCHQLGSNAGLPPVWMVYFQVSDLNQSLEACRKLGGKVLREPENSTCGSFGIIEYPVGAICGLSQM